jgi:hypothetical protein
MSDLLPYFNSTAIKRAEYETGRLTIWFPAGHFYNYCNVPENVWQGLLQAASKGKYFNTYIDGRYHC